MVPPLHVNLEPRGQASLWPLRSGACGGLNSFTQEAGVRRSRSAPWNISTNYSSRWTGVRTTNYITTHEGCVWPRRRTHAGNTAKPYAGPALEQTRDSLASRRAAASLPVAALTCSAYCSDESERERARACGGAHEGGKPAGGVKAGASARRVGELSFCELTYMTGVHAPLRP